MNKVFIIFLLFFCAIYFLSDVHAQQPQSDLKAVIEKVFYNSKVHGLIFFTYRGDSVTFLTGRQSDKEVAFTLPDDNLQRFLPNLLDQVSKGHYLEQSLMTVTLISRPDGDVFITSNILDGNIKTIVNFDTLSISVKAADLDFHTTSLHKRDTVLQNYFSVKCSLIKKNNRWKIRKLIIEPCGWHPIF